MYFEDKKKKYTNGGKVSSSSKTKLAQHICNNSRYYFYQSIEAFYNDTCKYLKYFQFKKKKLSLLLRLQFPDNFDMKIKFYYWVLNFQQY